jgi:hypothetical protein
MTFHPATLALHISSILILFMILYSARYGIQILTGWDIESGSERQLVLERKTYLISTLLAYAFGFQLLSLFLFIFTVDHLHILFVGAMCAAGSLYVNGYGYPALVLKIVSFILAGLWLIINHADNMAYDYPLIRKKYLFLLLISPVIFIEAVLQWNYFLRLNPDVITSCCGSLFSTGTETMTSEIASLPSIPMKVIFYLSMASTVGSGFYFYLKNRGGYLFASLSAFAFVVSILSILSFISLYYYELPTHHCPFCILQREYGYVGYPLYIALLGGGVSGMGVGLLMPFRKIGSLSEALPSLQKRLTLASSILFAFFAVMVTLRMVFSDFILEGY